MAILLADILLGLVVEHDDLLGLAVLNHLGSSLYVFYYGLAYGDVLSVCYQQNVKADICADLCVQFSTEITSPTSALYCLPPV